MIELPKLKTFELIIGKLVWFFEKEPYWQFMRKMAQMDQADDALLVKIAIYARGLAPKDDKQKFTPFKSWQEAREAIRCLPPHFLQDLTVKAVKALQEVGQHDFSAAIRDPYPTPHWKKKLDRLSLLSKEQQKTLNSALQEAKQELENPDLLEEATLKTLLITEEGREQEEEREENEAREPKQQDVIEVKVKEKQIFKLTAEMRDLHSLIQSGLLTTTVQWGGHAVQLRFIPGKEVEALQQKYPRLWTRERFASAMAICGYDDLWCLSSTEPSELQLQIVDAWDEDDAVKFMEQLQKLRLWADSLIPYVEATPFLKTFNNTWINYKLSGNQWWSDQNTGIQGTGLLPMNEHQNLFIEECTYEEKEKEGLRDDSRLAIEVVGVAPDLARSIQEKTAESYRLREMQLNYMLYGTAPDLSDREKPGQIHIPQESSKEELTEVLEKSVQGDLDYHDMMLALLEKRKDVIRKIVEEKQTQEPTEDIPGSDWDAFDGGSVTLSLEESQALQAAQRARAVQQEGLIVSANQMEEIARVRKRSLLQQGRNPYSDLNDDDSCIDLGPVPVTRTKNYHTEE